MEKTFLTCAIVVTTVSNFVAYRTEFRTYQKPISPPPPGTSFNFWRRIFNVLTKQITILLLVVLSAQDSFGSSILFYEKPIIE